MPKRGTAHFVRDEGEERFSGMLGYVELSLVWEVSIGCRLFVTFSSRSDPKPWESDRIEYIGALISGNSVTWY